MCNKLNHYLKLIDLCMPDFTMIMSYDNKFIAIKMKQSRTRVDNKYKFYQQIVI